MNESFMLGWSSWSYLSGFTSYHCSCCVLEWFYISEDSFCVLFMFNCKFLPGYSLHLENVHERIDAVMVLSSSELLSDNQLKYSPYKYKSLLSKLQIKMKK